MLCHMHNTRGRMKFVLRLPSASLTDATGGVSASSIRGIRAPNKKAREVEHLKGLVRGSPALVSLLKEKMNSKKC